MPYTSLSMCRSTTWCANNQILYTRSINVSENMDIEVLYKDKYFNYAYEVYKISVTSSGIKRELIGDTIYWTTCNLNNKNDTFLVLKDGVIVKEEKEEKEEKEDKDKEQVDNDVEYDEDNDYDTTEDSYLSPSDEESNDEESINPNIKRTTGFLVFASENKNNKTDFSIINLGPLHSAILGVDKMRELGEMWQKLSEEQQINYSKKAQLINKHYAEFVEVNLD
jgi:hypothetical protein